MVRIIENVTYNRPARLSGIEAEEIVLRYVQSSISVIGFPKKLEEIEEFLYTDDESEEERDWATHLDLLIESAACEDPDLYWTAPRWMTQNDILFLYHAKSAEHSVRSLLREALGLLENLDSGATPHGPESDERDRRLMEEIIQLLEHAAVQSEKYSGTIFGCAEILGATEYLKDDGIERHYSGRFFVPLGQVFIFDHPLHADEFADFVRIEQSTSNTPLYEQQFEGIKRRISERSTLPGFLHHARIGGKAFYNADKHNWPSISCDDRVRFVNEAQLRTYLLDFLLDELKDRRMPLLRECQCYRNGERTGRADYFVRVHDAWVPVEAKLNIKTERAILDQVAKYTNIDSFVPMLGSHRDTTYKVDPSSVCLIVDQSGVYIVSDGKFSGCSPSTPVWRREDLDHSTVRTIRDQIRGRKHG